MFKEISGLFLLAKATSFTKPMKRVKQMLFSKRTEKMTQLDQFTYLTQFVWLCMFYMTLYVLLPKISNVLKITIT